MHASTASSWEESFGGMGSEEKEVEEELTFVGRGGGEGKACAQVYNHSLLLLVTRSHPPTHLNQRPILLSLLLVFFSTSSRSSSMFGAICSPSFLLLLARRDSDAGGRDGNVPKGKDD